MVPVEADDGALAPAALRRPPGPGPRRGVRRRRHAGGPRPTGLVGRRGRRSHRARVLAAPRPRAPRRERRRGAAVPRGHLRRVPLPRPALPPERRVGERRARGMPPGAAPGRPAPRDRLGLQVAPLGPRRGGARRPPLHPARARRARAGGGLHAGSRLLRLLPRLPGRGGGTARPARRRRRLRRVSAAAPAQQRAPRRAGGRAGAPPRRHRCPSAARSCWWRGRRPHDGLGRAPDVQRARGHRRRGRRDPRGGRRCRGAGRRRRLAGPDLGGRGRAPSPGTRAPAPFAGSGGAGSRRRSPRASRRRRATWSSGWTPTAPCRADVIPRLVAATAAADVAVASRYAAGGRDAPRLRRPHPRVPGDQRLRHALPRRARCATGPRASWRPGGRRSRRVPIRADHVYGDYCIDFLHRACRRGLRVVEVPYACVERRAGTTKTSPSPRRFAALGLRYVQTIWRLRRESRTEEDRP